MERKIMDIWRNFGKCDPLRRRVNTGQNKMEESYAAHAARKVQRDEDCSEDWDGKAR